MKKANILIAVLSTVLLIGTFTGCANKTTPNSASATESSAKDLRTFTLSEKVKVEKVSYKNRFGITIAADMYTPKDIDESQKYPAIIVGPPFGGVKEQGAGIYAQTMAERGFVTIAFDPSYNGESSGEPRYFSSPDVLTEDFSAAVDYIGTRTFVNRDKIGVIGICGSGGFALTAAQTDTRIKAIATVSMYDIDRVIRNGLGDTQTEEQLKQTFDQLGEQRWKDFENGKTATFSQYPSEPADTVPEGLDSVNSEFFEYYGMKRGFHPEAGKHTMTSSASFLNFPLMSYIQSISPRPILLIAGEHAHSRYFSEDAYKKAAEPKELYIVPNAGHVDLYDKTDLIPFDKLESFFKEKM